MIQIRFILYKNFCEIFKKSNSKASYPNLYKAVETSDVGAYSLGALAGALAGCNFGALNIEILFFFQTIFLMFKKIKLF